MKDLSEFKSIMEPAIGGILLRWSGWAGEDELRALCIGFDVYNTEISVNLLTDREPYLMEQNIQPFSDEYGGWPTADWRLSNVNSTWSHQFPDAQEALDWMNEQREKLEEDEDLGEKLNLEIKQLLFEIVTGDTIISYLKGFRNLAAPFKVRVEWYGDSDDVPLEKELDID